MNILVVGCSKAGAALAGQLAQEGHDVSVIDRKESSQSLLPDDYSGYFTTGILIDQDALRAAGIENCDAVAAVSDDDNVNLMVAQIAKEVFGIETVITSLHDPVREELFGSRMTTVCPTNIAVASIKGYLLHRQQRKFTLGHSTVNVELMPVPEHLVGVRAREITCRHGETVLGVLREDEYLVLAQDDQTLLREGDQLAVVQIVD
jgi:trk system potassium uptake protein TrkA